VYKSKKRRATNYYNKVGKFPDGIVNFYNGVRNSPDGIVNFYNRGCTLTGGFANFYNRGFKLTDGTANFCNRTFWTIFPIAVLCSRFLAIFEGFIKLEDKCRLNSFLYNLYFKRIEKFLLCRYPLQGFPPQKISRPESTKKGRN
jgi:hypothetical protein